MQTHIELLQSFSRLFLSSMLLPVAIFHSLGTELQELQSVARHHPSAAKVVLFVSGDKEQPSHQKWLPGRINAAALKAQVTPML